MSRGKAASMDAVPDSMCRIKKNLKGEWNSEFRGYHSEVLLPRLLQWIRGKALSEKERSARMVLLSKNGTEIANPEETRPICVLSPVRKFIELTWLDTY
jgi:hypothetical protein